MFILPQRNITNCRFFFVAVKSQFRKQIEEVTKNSRIPKWMFLTPEENIDDPTGEIRRLKKQVQNVRLVFKFKL